MKLYWIILTMAVFTQAKKPFYSPIMSGIRNPSAIKFNGTYYLVSIDFDFTKGLFPLYTSTDLTNWELAGHVLKPADMPKWADHNTINAPRLQQVGSNFVVYYDAWIAKSNYINIGAASAPHPLGPYKPLKRQLVSERYESSYHPGLIQNKENLYLIWFNLPATLCARKLNADGISFSSDKTTKLFSVTLPWENDEMDYPWYVHKAGYHYIFYGNAQGSIGVARSVDVLGPYEKLQYPLAVSNSHYQRIGEASVIKDLRDTNDLILFEAMHEYKHFTILTTLDWENGWPVIGKL